MTVETALRRIARECRENVIHCDHWIVRHGRRGAGEARGTVATSREILDTIQELRREIRRAAGK